MLWPKLELIAHLLLVKSNKGANVIHKYTVRYEQSEYLSNHFVWFTFSLCSFDEKRAQTTRGYQNKIEKLFSFKLISELPPKCTWIINFSQSCSSFNVSTNLIISSEISSFYICCFVSSFRFKIQLDPFSFDLLSFVSNQIFDKRTFHFHKSVFTFC